MQTDDIVTRLRATATDERPLWRGEMMKAADEIERLHLLLKLFDDHYVCEPCYELCATYLQNCDNPLHQLHEAAWENE